MRGALVTGAALAVCIFVSGCRDDPGDERRASSTGKGSLLELTLDPDGPEGDEAPRVATVDCPDQPRPGPDEPCGNVLVLSPEDFEPLPGDIACSEIYGGPDTLTVSGTLEGEQVSGRFSREDGCEIDRFDTWVPLLRELFPGYVPGEALSPG